MSLNAKEIATIEPLTEVLRQFLPSSEFTNSAALPDHLPGLAASLLEVYRLSPLPVQVHRRDSPSPSAATSPSWAADLACRPLAPGLPVRARRAPGTAARPTDWLGHPASCQRLGPFRAHACAGAANRYRNTSCLRPSPSSHRRFSATGLVGPRVGQTPIILSSRGTHSSSKRICC